MARLWLLAVLLGLEASQVVAQDSVRGAQLYLRLTSGTAGCIACHGPDPTQGRNNILRAADNPNALLKALNDVGAMGFLRPLLSASDVVDLSAYLGRVSAMANPLGPVGLWPPTLEFGTVSIGNVAPAHRVRFENRSASSVRLQPPHIAAGPYTLVHDCPDLLAAGGGCELVVRGEPSSTGGSTGALRVSGDAPWSPLLVGLLVNGTAQGVPVLAPQLPDRQLQFPAVPFGESYTLPWTLFSTGTEPVTLANASVSGPQASEFRITGDCVSGRTLPPSAGCTLQITHRPVVALRSRATLQVRGNGTNPMPLELLGDARAAEPAASSPDPASPSGGGCAAVPPASTRFDPMLLALLALGAAGLVRRRALARGA